jgi:7-cyano-7-deazaguanine reductase
MSPADEEDKGPLGKKVEAPASYCPSVLFPIARQRGRSLLGLAEASETPFVGVDIWNAYETSWLGSRGLPTRRTLEVRVPATTPNISESKSLKLYLNSLNFHRFRSNEEAVATIAADLASVLGGDTPPTVTLSPWADAPLMGPEWECIDEEELGKADLLVPDGSGGSVEDESHLRVVPGAAAAVSERLCTHLLRTLCPVTGQPDWGSVLIEYTGLPIDRAGLLRYIVSLRCEVGFHENAVECAAHPPHGLDWIRTPCPAPKCLVASASCSSLHRSMPR